jgi:thioredoxin-related protein
MSHPAVLDRLGRSCGFRTVDLTQWSGKPAQVAKHYGVRAVPTLIFVDARGREVSRYNGARDVKYFCRWIDQHSR